MSVSIKFDTTEDRKEFYEREREVRGHNRLDIGIVYLFYKGLGIRRIRERILIDGKKVSERYVRRVVKGLREAMSKLKEEI